MSTPNTTLPSGDRTQRQKCDVQAALGLDSLNDKSDLSNMCIIQQKRHVARLTGLSI